MVELAICSQIGPSTEHEDIQNNGTLGRPILRICDVGIVASECSELSLRLTFMLEASIAAFGVFSGLISHCEAIMLSINSAFSCSEYFRVEEVSHQLSVLGRLFIPEILAFGSIMELSQNPLKSPS